MRKHRPVPGPCRAHSRVVPFALVALAVGLAACGGGGTDREQELRALLEARDYPEVQARVALYRADGERGVWLDFSEGLALLSEDADNMAVPLLERAVAADSTLAPWAARELATRARDDWANSWEDRATRRMADARRFDSSTDLGEMIDSVADHLYRFEKDYTAAYTLYRTLADRAREMGPDGGPKAREWLFRWGYCLEQEGFRDAAMAVYEEYQERFRGEMKLMRRVMWLWKSHLIEQAREARAASDPEGALALLRRTQEDGWHMDLQQQARYLAGEIEQARGNLEAALDWYQKVLADGSSFGGEVVDDAKTRLDELRAQGVY